MGRCFADGCTFTPNMGSFGSDWKWGPSRPGREGRTEGRPACEPKDQSTWVMFGLLGAQTTVELRSAGLPLRREGTVSRPLKTGTAARVSLLGHCLRRPSIGRGKEVVSQWSGERGEGLSGPGVVGMLLILCLCVRACRFPALYHRLSEVWVSGAPDNRDVCRGTRARGHRRWLAGSMQGEVPAWSAIDEKDL